MAIKPFEDFVLHATPNGNIIEKYTNILHHALIDVWKNYRFGSFAKGFLRTINPEEYQELLNETYIHIKRILLGCISRSGESARKNPVI